MEPDFVVLEPSGYHYEKLFTDWFNRHNVPYRRAVGKRLGSYRESKGLINKNDGVDAYALALYGHEFYADRRAFIPACELEDLRQWWLQRDGLKRSRTRLINRFKQQLSHEFPEVREIDFQRDWGKPVHGLILWILGDAPKPTKTYYDSIYDGGRYRKNIKVDGKTVKRMTDVPGTIGCGISDFTRSLARLIYDLESQCLEIESRCEEYMKEERFIPYMQAFDSLMFSQGLRAILLTRLYPFERFLGDDDRPVVVKRLSKQGKMCTYDLSLGQFKAALGAGMRENKSGIRQANRDRGRKWRGRSDRSSGTPAAEVPIGDGCCRRAFFLWCLNRIETGQLKEGKYIDRLHQKRNELKAKGKKLYQRSGNLYGLALRFLYRELLSKV